MLHNPHPATKRRLTVIIGAGASIGGGAPSVGDLTRHVLAMISPRVIGDFREYLIREDNIDKHAGLAFSTPSEPAVAQIERALRSIRSSYNFETVLHAVETLEPYVAARTLVNQLADVRPILTAFTDPTPRYDSLMNWALLWRLRWDIIRLVRLKVLEGSSAPQDCYLRQSGELLSLLRSAFTVHAFNLNYDDLLERDHHWSDGYPRGNEIWTVFDRAAYAESLLSADHVMTHLHGSVRFGYIPSTSSATAYDPTQRQVVKYTEPLDATPSLQYPPAPRYTDDIIDDSAPIISGANKVMKFTTPPYSYYFSAFQQAAQRNDRILFLGYGFTDPHVNNWVLEAVQHHGQKQMRVAVVDYRYPQSTWLLERNSTFVELTSRLTDGTLDTEGPMSREFVSSGRIGVTVGGYPTRTDIAQKIVAFLKES
jgi:hypothetical protein